MPGGPGFRNELHHSPEAGLSPLPSPRHQGGKDHRPAAYGRQGARHRQGKHAAHGPGDARRHAPSPAPGLRIMQQRSAVGDLRVAGAEPSGVTHGDACTGLATSSGCGECVAPPRGTLVGAQPPPSLPAQSKVRHLGSSAARHK